MGRGGVQSEGQFCAMGRPNFTYFESSTRRRQGILVTGKARFAPGFLLDVDVQLSKKLVPDHLGEFLWGFSTIKNSFEKNKAATMCYIPLVFVFEVKKWPCFWGLISCQKILRSLSLCDKLWVWHPKAKFENVQEGFTRQPQNPI